MVIDMDSKNKKNKYSIYDWERAAIKRGWIKRSAEGEKGVLLILFPEKDIRLSIISDLHNRLAHLWAGSGRKGSIYSTDTYSHSLISAGISTHRALNLIESEIWDFIPFSNFTHIKI